MTKIHKYDVWVVPFTHWDRAWYLPFEQFRQRLVVLFDKLLDIYRKNKDFKHFTFDGQTIVIEDYLEIRPEKRAEIEKAVRSGRLALGPWYVLPDAYLVSGESLIRNLSIGHKIAKSFGKVMKAGFIPDPFGHPTAMPAIMQGFGIDNYIFMRGAPPEAAKLGVVFRWVAPDGSKVIATRQAAGGYVNLAEWGKRPGYEPDDPDYDVEKAMDRVKRLIESMEHEGLNTRNVLFNNGVDHCPAQPFVPELIREANRRFKNMTLRQGTVEHYTNAIRKEKLRLKEYTGELHSGWNCGILSGTFSSRIWIKQQNFECQRLLETIAEPVDAFLGASGIAATSPYIEYAWKTLLKAHPHDDICGCSIDSVHNDDSYYFRHVRQAALASIHNGLNRLAGRIVTRGIDKEDTVILGYNPEPRQRGAEISVLIRWREGFGRESRRWRVRRSDGKVLSAALERTPEIDEYSNLIVQYGHRLTFFDPAMPPGGYVTYFFEKGTPAEPPAELKANRATIENSLLRATLKPNGTVDLLEKDTGRRFTGLNLLEDTEDAGDEYDYSPLRKSSRTLLFKNVRGKIGKARIRVGHAEVTVTLRLNVPAAISADHTARLKQTMNLPVKVTIRLRPGVRRLEFVMTVNNRARDHRLRVHFPTSVRRPRVLASSHFDLVERPADPGKGTENHEQPALSTQHMDEFVAVQTGKQGALITSKGLPEYEAAQGPSGVTLVLTLFRCVGWLSRSDLLTRRGDAGPHVPSPAAQCQGIHTFEYAFVPFVGDVVCSGAAACAREFGIPVIGHVPNVLQDMLRRTGGNAPPVESWLKIDRPEIILSAVKRAASGKSVAVRVYNIADKRVTARIELAKRIKSAQLARLDETPLKRIRTSGNSISLSLKPKEIATVIITL